MSIIVSIFKKELIDVLRDRRTLMFMVVIPILITPLLVIGSIKFQEYQNKKSEEKILKIAYINESEDSLTKQLLSDQKGVKIIEGVPIDSIESYIKSDSLQGGLYLGKGFLKKIKTNSSGDVKIYYKSSDLMSKSKKRIQAALDIYKEKIIAERLKQLNVDGQILEPINITNIDMATAKETLGKAVGGFIPYVLVMFIFLGAMYPAIDLGAGEKERGSLETLLSSPATKFEITIGKLLVVSLTGIVSGVVSVLGISFGQTTPEFLFNEGNKAYNAGNYENAISLYEQTLKMGKHSADVYYNLGNANYRLNKVAESVYYFEKAKLMRPKDRDIITNSAFANNMTIDAIEKIPVSQIDQIRNSIIEIFSFEIWTYFTVILLWIFTFLFLAYLFFIRARLKRIFFFSSLSILLLFILSFSITYSIDQNEKNKKFAILFSKQTDIWSEPNQQAERLFVLHEGTKMQLLDSLEEWQKIRIANGSEGWITDA